MTSHTKKWKHKQSEELRELIQKYHVIGIADTKFFPSALFSQLRKKLHGKAVVKVSKARVIQKALEGLKGKEKLKEFAKGSCALIFTEMNPFELYAFLKKSKGKISAKIGAIAEDDIIIPAGDSGLPPGPALSDLKAVGLKVAVQGSTIAIMADKVVTKKGEAITQPVAGTLSKLNIKPFKVGLNLVAALEHSDIYNSSILDIDTDRVFANFVSAHQKAFNLAFNASITNRATIELLLAKAFNDSKGLALEANILNSATAGSILGKVQLQASALKALVKDVPAAAQDPVASAQTNGGSSA